MNLRNEPRLCSTVRHLLRNLDDPCYLRKHPLVTRSLALSRNSASDDPVALLAAARWLIETASAALPVPLQTIIVRCDLGRELHRSVASSLGFSERYFYKLRRRALLLLGRLLSDAAEGHLPRAQIGVVADRLDGRLCSADALKNSGDYMGAANVLEDVASRDSDAADSTYANYLLADLFLDVDRTDEANEYLKRGKATLSALTINGEKVKLLEYELDSIEAMLAMQYGAKSASGLTERAMHRLRQLPHDSRSHRREKALCNLLLATATFHQVNGAFGDGLAAALEARNILEQYSIDRPALKVLAFAQCSMIRYSVTGATRAVVPELTQAFTFATLHALPRVAAQLAAALCTIHSRQKDIEGAMRFGELALSMSLNVCTPEEVASICAQVTRARVANRDTPAARTTLKKANLKNCASTMQGILELVAAELYVAERRFDRALAASTRAADLFEKRSWIRFHGSALSVQAEALVGRGDRLLARKRIGEALEILEPTGTTDALVHAYQLSSQLSHNKVHLKAAKALTDRGKE
jgi:tetratricopeptide (TPR) repeat protein